MRIALFALTGLGNEVLRCLVKETYIPTVLVTRKEKGDYPYYKEKNIAEEARALGIEVAFGKEGENIVRKDHFDVLIICTYHRILTPEIFSRADLSINFHPSLLPAYRGASPFYWVIRNGESKTGLTAHLLTDKPDAGDIVSIKEIPLDPGETQGSLRQKLSKGAFELTSEVMRKIKAKSLVHEQQDETKASSYPRLNDTLREIDLTWTPAELRRHLDGLKPYPGALYNGFAICDEEAFSLLTPKKK